MTEHTQWNGQPCTAMRVMVVVADSGQFPQYWARHLVGTGRKAVRVDYGGETFYLDDEDGTGWDKVTHGGSPNWGHRSLEVEPGTVTPRLEADADTEQLARAVDHAIPPAIDRAIRRDHSLCGAEPCSDCR